MHTLWFILNPSRNIYLWEIAIANVGGLLAGVAWVKIRRNRLKRKGLK